MMHSGAFSYIVVLLDSLTGENVDKLYGTGVGY
jgi:hypothetical protein